MRKIIGTPRILCDGMKGENYWLFGCTAYLAECLGLGSEYDYMFFTNVSGDGVTQIYSKDPCKNIWYPSYEFVNEALERIFSAIGYSYRYYNNITDANRENYLTAIRASLAENKPVISRRRSDDGEFTLIIGEDDGILLELYCDNTEPHALPMDFSDLIFCDQPCNTRPDMATVYRDAIMRVPSLLTQPERSGCSFGAAAFEDWADAFENGTISNIPDDKLNMWSAYGTNLCMLGTNGFGFGLYKRALHYNPDMVFIKKITPIYDTLDYIFHSIAYHDANGNDNYENGGMLGGFNLSKENAKDPIAMKPICDKLREAASLTRKIVDVYTSLLDGEKIIDVLTYKDVQIDVLEKDVSIFTGALGYAPDCENEPDIGGLIEKYQQLSDVPKQNIINADWSGCLSINYESDGKFPRGIMFMQQTATSAQDSRYDTFEINRTTYMRIKCDGVSAVRLLGKEHCEVYELFGELKEAAKINGYTVDNSANDIEMYNHFANMSYAYVPVKNNK